jgi:hypothetical protein
MALILSANGLVWQTTPLRTVRSHSSSVSCMLSIDRNIHSFLLRPLQGQTGRSRGFGVDVLVVVAEALHGRAAQVELFFLLAEIICSELEEEVSCSDL